MINGITFSECLITSGDFAHFMYTMLGNTDGVTKGCEISTANDLIYIQKGYFLQSGRMVQVVGIEEVESPDVQSGQLYCKVVFEIDLSKSNTAEEFAQGYFKTLTSTTGYPDVTQEDLSDGGVVYQMPWATYIKTVNGIEDFKDVRSVYDQESIWKVVQDQHAEYKAEFEEYFNEQKEIVEDMVKNLKNESFATQEDLNTLSEEVEETKKSVSDGKALIAAAITLKKIATAATDTFATMADNIKQIVLGSGNATESDVLEGVTFTNDGGMELTGTMSDLSDTTQAAAPSLDETNSRLQMTIPEEGKYNTASKLYAAYSTICTLIGLTADKLWPGNTILGVTSSKSSMAGGTYTPTTAQQTIACSGKAMTSNIIINAMPVAAWSGWKEIKKATAQKVTASGTSFTYEFDLSTEYSKYNTFVFSVIHGKNISSAEPENIYRDAICLSTKEYDSTLYGASPNRNNCDACEIVQKDVEFDIYIGDELNGAIEVYYCGDADSVTRYAWFEVYLVAALAL